VWDASKFTVNCDVRKLLSDRHYSGEEVVDKEHLKLMTAEAASISRMNQKCIFNHVWPSTLRAEDNDDRRMTVGGEYPELQKWATQAKEMIEQQCKKKMKMIGMAYVWADTDQPQVWHRDVPLGAMEDKELIFAVMTPVSVDTPEGPTGSFFVPHSANGMPRPFMAVPITKKMGGYVSI
jgi:hypothetical protein